MKYVAVLAFAVLVSAELDDCLNRDSITCLQLEMYRKARGFFDQEKIELFGGLALTKKEVPAEDRARSLKESGQTEGIIEAAKDPKQREEALENFAWNRASKFLEERSLTWNLTPLAGEIASASRSISESIPTEVKEGVSSLFEEGRGKKKKLMKALLPFLLGLKMKLAGFMVLSYFVIAFLAKKALLASLISLAIAGFIAVKKLMSQHHTPHEVHEVPHGWAGGYSGAAAGGWDSYGGHDVHGAYSNNVAQTLAYSGQKPVARSGMKL